MVEDKGILIQNIYYMLSYAFQALRQTNFDEIKGEPFENTHDLFAAILAKGVAQQLKQGLCREYRWENDCLPTLRGRLNMPGTIRETLQRKRRLACEFDEFSENNRFNQILKTTMRALAWAKDVKRENQAALRRNLKFFGAIDEADPRSIQWRTMCYRPGNQSYQLLMNLCYFVLDGLLMTTEKGQYRLAAFSDEHMHRLYERFILEYYRQHFKSVHASASQIAWNLDAGDPRYLPSMQTDITLTRGERVAIIDAKYYGHTMQTRYDKATYHSGNLYQLFTYVKNRDKAKTGSVSGALLYARTQEAITPDGEFVIDGNTILIKTLDLNQPFGGIAQQLDALAQRLMLAPPNAPPGAPGASI